MLNTLSTIVCIAHLARLHKEALDAASAVLAMEQQTGVEMWDTMGQPIHHARVAMGDSLASALSAIGVSIHDQWKAGRTLNRYTKRYEWEPWPNEYAV